MTAFYVEELNRLLAVCAPRFVCFPHAPIGQLPTATRWIRCSTCVTSQYRTYPILWRTRMCPDCKDQLLHEVLEYFVRQVHKLVHASRLVDVHEELLQVCFSPKYVFQTGWIETRKYFSSD